MSNRANAVFLAIAPLLWPINPKGKNLIVSPASLHAAVSLIAAGASGPTLQQLLSFLKSDSIDDVNALSSELASVLANSSSAVGPKLSFANSLWIHKGLSLKDSFKKVLDKVYKASSHQVDFDNTEEIISQVNSWADEQTNGLIKDFLAPSSINPLTRLILANALCFKGAWGEWLEEVYFDASETQDYDFHLLGGDSVKVPFMTSDPARQHCIGTYDGFQVLRLPYKQGGGDDKRRFSMYILLPNSKDGLPALMEKVGSEPGFLSRHLPVKSVDVNKFRLPRFKISFEFTASDILKQLGVSLPFEAGGLTEMVDSIEESEELFLSRIYQKCFIEVNERGTEAAAVTEEDCSLGFSLYTPDVDFVADHPFMFLIREDTGGVVLFFGYVLNPLDK